ncbi:MAG: hypothetical protein JWM50_2235 [Microbacteriaceae bacterium]|nr:hypothetical protein [Microbacteriaceae bacterium]
MSDDSGIHWTQIDAPKGLPPRFRWIGWIIVLAVVAALVTFALIEGDKIARDVAGDVVRTGVTTALKLPEGQEVDVDLGGGLLVFQAITGSIDDVRVSIPDVAFGEAVGTLVLRVSDVPLDPRKAVGTLDADMRLDGPNMLLLSGYLSAAPLTSVTLADSAMTIGADLAGVPTTLVLTPSVTDLGQVVFTPGAATAGGAPASVEELVAGPLGPVAAPLLTSQPLCVAQFLPDALTVSQARVDGPDFVVTATGTDVTLSALATKGNCEPPPAA